MKTAKNTVLCGLAFAAASSARATRREDVAAGEPCAAISDMVAEIGYDAAFPPSLAWDCLTSIPLDVNASTAFIDYILPYVSLISNVDDLGSPGPEYAVPGVDLAGGLGQIRRKAREGGYGSQFEFEAEVKSVVVRAQDGHTNLYTALTEFFAFATNTSLVSISRDGVEIPKIYILDDAFVLASGCEGCAGWAPSSVWRIDDKPAEAYVEDEVSVHANSQDPDALVNEAYESTARYAKSSARGRLGKFSVRDGHYLVPDSTTLHFANGTRSTKRNLAVLNEGANFNWTAIRSGKDLGELMRRYAAAAAEQFVKDTAVGGSDRAASASAAAAAAGKMKGLFRKRDGGDDEDEDEDEDGDEWSVPDEDELPPITPWDYYPYPYEMHRTGRYMTAYFLNSTSSGGEDEDEDDDLAAETGVVAINGFAPAVGETDAQDLVEYFRALQKYMEEFVARGRKKLVLDLRANGGGSPYLALYTFQMLFGGVEPYTGVHFRATEGLDFIGRNLWSEEYLGEYGNALAGSRILLAGNDANGTAYDGWDDLFGPVIKGEFSKSRQTREVGRAYNDQLQAYIDEIQEAAGEEKGSTTVEDYTDVVPEGYFEPEDVIVLTDGICASACPIFVNFLTYTMGVRTIAIGGRARETPMQSRGGTRGGIVNYYNTWAADINLAKNVTHEDIPKGLPSTEGSPLAIAAFRLNGENMYPPPPDDEDEVLGSPLQFRYEAANCRMFYTAETATNPVKLWKAVMGIAFEGDKKCVKGSTVNQDGSIGDEVPRFTEDVLSTAKWAELPGGIASAKENVKNRK